MKSFGTAVLGAASAAVLSMAAVPAAHAQGVDASATVGDHGNYTLKQREIWLSDHLDKARDDGSVDRSEFDRVHHEISRIRGDEDRLRDAHDGQLTDNENTELEARLDGVANQIHWLHEQSFQRPW